MRGHPVRRGSFRGRLFAAATAGVLVTGPVSAQSADLEIEVKPYVWATGMGATLSLGARTVEVDQSFRDVLRDLDGAFFLSGFVRHGRSVYFGDISRSTSSRAGLLPPPAPGPLPAQGQFRQTSVTLAAGQRVVSEPGLTLDLMGGLRHWRINAATSVPDIGFAAERRVRFTDPILAARLSYEIAPGWSSLFYADLGGFGVGSRFTGQFLATVSYAATDGILLTAGYRHLTVDYRDGGVRVDARLSGPVLGATFRF